LFFAQGFVQAQDRLFQMDLWRRAALGRLSEVLGGNFIDRDTMTRRIQYRGDPESEWASYGPDTNATNAIAAAFVRGVNTWVAGRAAASAGEVTFSEAAPRLNAPSPRYLVHLVAPGWNVIGAAAPWLPGVAYGHNDRVAWAMMPIDVDTQDVYVERTSTTPVTVVGDRIRVKGRADPLAFQIESTPRGVIVSTDRERGLAFVVGWRGFEPGAAAEM